MTALYEKLYNMREGNLRVAKGADNPFFKSKFADLNSVISVTDPLLSEAGLVYYDSIEDMTLVSVIADPETEESIQSNCPLILVKNDMQQLGGAVTYARRYNRMALFGLMAVDDDGNEVTRPTQPTYKTASKATEAEKLAYKKQFMGVLVGRGVDVLEFFEFLHIDATDANATHNSMIQFLRSPNLFTEQVDMFLKSKNE